MPVWRLLRMSSAPSATGRPVSAVVGRYACGRRRGGSAPEPDAAAAGQQAGAELGRELPGAPLPAGLVTSKISAGVVPSPALAQASRAEVEATEHEPSALSV
jgi:hypothetical protein